MLEFTNVGKRYGQVTVLRDVSLTVAPGEILALCGENGAGKSTLVSILAGAIPHGRYDGELRLDNTVLSLSGPAAAEAQGIAMLPQELVFYPDLSIGENVLAAGLPSRFGIVDRRQVRRRARQLLDAVGLAVPVDTPMRRLETSARQLVCVARALARDPRVLILDEPTAALPHAAAERLFDVLRRIAAQGRMVIYISHHLTELAGLASRVAVLRNGSLVMQPRERPSVDDIVRAMLGTPTAGAGHERPAAPAPTRAAGGPAALAVTVERLEFGQRTVLADIDLALRAGELTGLAGLTGSGREELIRVCAGAHRGRLRGRVSVDGREMRRWSPRLARLRSVFFLAEDRRSEGLLVLRDVAANVLLGSESLGARLGWRRPRREHAAVARAVRRAEVRDSDHGKLVGRLSGGNQQRVLFARPLLQDSKVLLLAEPTRGIDVGARAVLHELVRELAGTGRAVLVSSSDGAELATLCQRVLVLRRGRIVAELAGADLTEEAIARASAVDTATATDTATGTQSDVPHGALPPPSDALSEEQV